MKQKDRQKMVENAWFMPCDFVSDCSNIIEISIRLITWQTLFSWSVFFFGSLVVVVVVVCCLVNTNDA